MAYENLGKFIQAIEEDGELKRVSTLVSPNLEITEITDRISKEYGPALLFENNGTDFPLLINSMGNYKRMCMALGVKDMDEVSQEIEGLFKMISGPKEGFMDKLKMLPKLGQISSWMPKVISGKGKCQEVVMEDPDLTKLPVLTCWPEDGGPFITLPVIHTKDPNTGIRNVGMYRMQVFGPKLTGMHWHRHKVSARHFNEYKKLNKRMPVAVALGGDPVYTYSATAPLPDGIDEYMLAGFLRKKKVELVQCLTIDAQVPADADIIIEGYIDPNEEYILEGPFGDHTGYYSLADYYPKFHVTAITHRKDAVYPTTIVGIPPQEDAWIGKATERIFLAPIKMTMVPEIIDMVLPMEGVFHNLVIVKITKDYPGQAIKVMNSLWGAGQMMFTKMVVIVDGDVNIHNNLEVAQYISKHVDPERDIMFSQGPTDVLDHSCSTMAFGGKMGIDATKKLPEELRLSAEFETTTVKINNQSIIEAFAEVKSVNSELLSLNVSMVFIGVEKSRKNHVKELHAQLMESGLLKDVKVVLYLESNFDLADTADAVWRFSNNVDPRRDHIITPGLDENHVSTVGLDGTRKTKEHDGFNRDWPNILASTPEVMDKVDVMWDELGLGEFIKSPSRKYHNQLYKGGAIAE
ncbi:MAG: 4-hydroxy-3-polyprenylbenzoate decarboxylase [Sphingobacteriales bacterium]|jgi:4-hydroxy-3-polyprenylbenzoate decarboxylase